MYHQIKMGSASDFNSEMAVPGTGGINSIVFPNENDDSQLKCNVQLEQADESPSSILRLPEYLNVTNTDDFLYSNYVNDSLDGCFEAMSSMTHESSDDSELTTNNYANSLGKLSADELFFPKPSVQENKNNHKNNDIVGLDKKGKKNVTYLITHSVPVDCFTGSKCLGGDSNSKNAIAARDNRLKKKRYVASLEESLKDLKDENEHLSLENEKNKKALMVLKNEVTYLRSVIANQTTLAAILRNVSKTPGIKLSTSFSNQSTGTKNLGQNNTALEENASDDIPFTSSINSNSHCDHVKKRRTLRSSKSYSFVESQKIPKQKYQKRKLKGTHRVEPSYSVKNTSKDHFNERIETKKDGCFSQDFDDNLPINVEDIDSDEPSELLTTDTKVAAGICFHVSGENVSLEFCSQCNASAHTEIMSDHSYVKI